MPSLEFIRAHRGDAEAQVRRVEAEHAAQFVPTDLATRVALAEEQMYDELARLVKPEAIARLRAAEDQMLREIIGGPDA